MKIIETIIFIAILVVMGIVIITAMSSPSKQISSSSTEATFPEPTNYVVNPENILKQETVDKLNTELASFDGKAQIAVLVIKSTKPLEIEEYGIKLADDWKVGYKDKDNGAIIILATEDRKVRIEIGKGLEGDLPDAITGRIIDEAMIPSSKTSDWDTAVINAVNALKLKLNK